jgi:hypothetical protein
MGCTLDAAHRIPSLAELNGAKSFAELRMAWNGSGLAVWLEVKGKATPPWCRATPAAPCVHLATSTTSGNGTAIGGFR